MSRYLTLFNPGYGDIGDLDRSMQTMKLGNTDMELTRIGMGTWAIGGGGWQYGWGPQDDKDSIATIIRAVELGVNWLDTAAIYGLGHAEEIVGQALRSVSQKPFIATKCGRGGRSDGTIFPNLSKQNVQKDCEASLKRLGVDVIDLYQIHWPEPDKNVEDAWEAMARLLKQGKVRHIGVSNFSLQQLQRIQKIHPVASLQPQYSMLKREVEKDLLDYCKTHHIGVLAYSPMGRGLLTGTWAPQRTGQLAADDHRHNVPDFNEPRLSVNLELVENLKTIAARNGRTVAELAIAWVLRNKRVTAAIVGGRTTAQIDQTVKAGDWQLSQDDIKEVRSLLTRRDAQIAKLEGNAHG
jgi:aryl-alcohol dehydrogenase-like predicted oxidoreductase